MTRVSKFINHQILICISFNYMYTCLFISFIFYSKTTKQGMFPLLKKYVSKRSLQDALVWSLKHACKYTCTGLITWQNIYFIWNHWKKETQWSSSGSQEGKTHSISSSLGQNCYSVKKLFLEDILDLNHRKLVYVC